VSFRAGIVTPAAAATSESVTTRRTEKWHFSTGELLKLPVLLIHAVEGGEIERWHEFWNMPAFISQLPKS
jgi:limonene-1,2-epoxide hydrolase